MNSWGEAFGGRNEDEEKKSPQSTRRPQSKQVGMLEYKNHWNIGIMECWVYVF
jgi:hypothetical protein